MAEGDPSARPGAGRSPHQRYSGSRPSSLLLFERLDAGTLGKLVALYEHKVDVQGVIWDVNSFDQWGVQLGKRLASELTGAVSAAGGSEPAALAGALAAPTRFAYADSLRVAGIASGTMGLLPITTLELAQRLREQRTKQEAQHQRRQRHPEAAHEDSLDHALAAAYRVGDAVGISPRRRPVCSRPCLAVPTLWRWHTCWRSCTRRVPCGWWASSTSITTFVPTPTRTPTRGTPRRRPLPRRAAGPGQGNATRTDYDA